MGRACQYLWVKDRSWGGLHALSPHVRFRVCRATVDIELADMATEGLSPCGSPHGATLSHSGNHRAIEQAVPGNAKVVRSPGPIRRKRFG